MGNILLPKYYHPEFRLPDSKPASDAVVDKNNSLSYGLTHAFLFNNPKKLKDIVTNQLIPYKIESRATLTYKYIGRDVGIGRDYYTGSALHDDFLYPDYLYKNTAEITFVAGFIRTTDDRGFHVFTSGARDILGTQGGTFRAYLSDASGGSRLSWEIPLLVADGYKNIAMIKRAGSGDVDSYVDGVPVTPVITLNTLGTGLVQSENSASILDGSGYTGSGFFTYFYVFNRALSAGEAKSISDSPYQILKPANDQYYFVTDGGGAGGDNYSGTATSTNASSSTASGQKASTGTAASTADDTATTSSFKTGLGNVTSINTASTVKTGLAIMLGTAISLNVAATTTTGTKSETATGTATSSNTSTATTTGDKTGLGTAASNNTSITTTDGVQSGTGAGSATSTNTALTATTGSKSGLGLVSSVNGYLITLQSNAIMLGTAASSNTSESTVIGLSENDASGTLTSTSTSQTITAGTKIGLGDVDSANTSVTTTTATTDREGTLTSANTSSAIVSGANTAAPVIIRSVDLVCELPYILLTRAIDGSLFMAYPPEVSNITTAYQNNDTNINVVITDNGETVSMGSITEAEYVIASRDKSQTYVSKSLGSGISKGSEQLVLSLSQADTSALLDIYYHELQITSDGKHATVFAEHINFIDTVI